MEKQKFNQAYENIIKTFTFKNGDTLSHAFSSLDIPENKIFGFVNKLKSEFNPKKIPNWYKNIF